MYGWPTAEPRALSPLHSGMQDRDRDIEIDTRQAAEWEVTHSTRLDFGRGGGACLLSCLPAMLPASFTTWLEHWKPNWSTGDPRYEYAPVAQRLLRPEARSPWQPRRRHQRRRSASSWSCCCRRRRHNPRPPQHRQHIWRCCCCCCCWYWRETSCERRGQPQRRRHRRPEHR